MGEHTPGPWKAVEWEDVGRDDLIAEVDAVAVIAPGRVVGSNETVCLADAHLIAAAPEMKQVCVLIMDKPVKAWNHPRFDDTADDESVQITMTANEWRFIRDTLAKARGGDQ